MSLDLDFKKQVIAGLKRNSLHRPSKWAEAYRIMGQPEAGKWSFQNRPFLRELHDSQAEVNVIRKAAQLGLTETALNLILYQMDMNSRDCLYVLPSDRDARDFSAGRFNAAIEESQHIRNMFSDVKNVGHKRARSANLYIRGGRSTSGLKSIPVGVLILDEMNEMSPRAIALAMERQSGNKKKIAWYISTPTIPKVGVSEYFDLSTQEWFCFQCPYCSRRITLRWPESFVVCGEDVTDPRISESYIQCYSCKHPLPHETKGEWLEDGSWVADFNQRAIRGFALNQMFSPIVTPAEFALSYLKGLRDPAADQEFHNSKCGIDYVVPGGQVGDSEIEACVGGHSSGTLPAGIRPRSIGVDVGGRWLHYCVDEWDVAVGAGNDLNQTSRPTVVEAGKVENFEDIDRVVRRLSVQFGVVDANPEKRKSAELCARHYGGFAMCYYVEGSNTRQINYKENEAVVAVDRTSWMDLALGRFHDGSIVLPLDISLEFRQQIKEPVRRYRVNDKGQTVCEYVSSGADHFAHARTYSEIAFSTFLPNTGISQNIESPT